MHPLPPTLAHFLSDFKFLILKGENVTEALEVPEVIRALLRVSEKVKVLLVKGSESAAGLGWGLTF